VELQFPESEHLIPVQDSIRGTSISVEERVCSRLRNATARKWNFSKKSLYNNILWRNFRITRVLFVQHLPKNGLALPV
jgi:hypothetical protein